jgi:hypothetical protein
MSIVTVTTEQVRELIQQLAAQTSAASITPEMVANIFENMRQLNDQERAKVIATAEAYIVEIQNTGISAEKVFLDEGNVTEELNSRSIVPIANYSGLTDSKRAIIKALIRDIKVTATVNFSYAKILSVLKNFTVSGTTYNRISIAIYDISDNKLSEAAINVTNYNSGLIKGHGTNGVITIDYIIDWSSVPDTSNTTVNANINSYYYSDHIGMLSMDAKEELHYDEAPTQNSTNLVNSGVVYTSIKNVENKIPDVKPYLNIPLLTDYTSISDANKKILDNLFVDLKVTGVGNTTFSYAKVLTILKERVISGTTYNQIAIAIYDANDTKISESSIKPTGYTKGLLQTSGNNGAFKIESIIDWSAIPTNYLLSPGKKIDSYYYSNHIGYLSMLEGGYEFDNQPTEGSDNLLTSGTIYEALQNSGGGGSSSDGKIPILVDYTGITEANKAIIEGCIKDIKISTVSSSASFSYAKMLTVLKEKEISGVVYNRIAIAFYDSSDNKLSESSIAPPNGYVKGLAKVSSNNGTYKIEAIIDWSVVPTNYLLSPNKTIDSYYYSDHIGMLSMDGGGQQYEFDNQPTEGSNNLLTSGTIYEALQDISPSEFNASMYQHFYIRNHKLVANNDHPHSSGTIAKYIGAEIDREKLVRTVRCRFIVPSDFDNWTLTLIMMKKIPRIGNIGQGSLHVNFYKDHVLYGLYINAKFASAGWYTDNPTPPVSVDYDTPLVAGQEYEAVISLGGAETVENCNVCVIYKPVTAGSSLGTPIYYQSSEVTQYLPDCKGRYACWEFIGKPSTSSLTTDYWPKITGIKAYSDGGNVYALIDSFQREDGAALVAPTGQPYIHFRNVTSNDDSYIL